MTGSVAAGFGAGFAIDLPFIGTLVGTLVGAGLAAFVHKPAAQAGSSTGLFHARRVPNTVRSRQNT